MNRAFKKLALFGVLVVGSAYATEMRTPWIAERGPLRYTFEKLKTDKYNFNMWSSVHAKEAHSAYLKHGTKTHELSALIFNKSEFRLNEIFPDSSCDMKNENYSPFLNLTKVEPQVNYTEWGITAGARWDYPIWKEKGRIGLRTTIPFRSIEMENKDIIDDDKDPRTEFIAVNIFPADTTKTRLVVKSYNMALVKGLPYDENRTPALIFGNGDAIANPLGGADITPYAQFTGQEMSFIHDGQANLNEISTGIVNGVKKQNAPAGVIESTIRPDHRVLAYDYNDDTDFDGPVVLDGSHGIVNNNGTLTAPVSHDQVNPFPVLDNVAFFSGSNAAENPKPANAHDYRSLNDRPADEQLLKLWMVLARDKDSKVPTPGLFTAEAKTISDAIEARLDMYREHPYAFFARNGYKLDTQKRTGMGDIDLDLFYEHTFNKEWMAELFVGVRLPTGGDQDKYGNPYKVMEGNGEHWEIKLGGMLAYQPWKYMNMKLDAYYSFVLEGTEHRMAAFKGAQIKNWGPRADADVDWGYFVGRFDFNFFHPKTSDIRGTLGYEFYYKTEDHLHYKLREMESFAGRQWILPTVNPAVAGHWAADPRELSNDLARKNTESISHKVRVEGSYQTHKYLEMYAGGTATFAGQNVMRDWDAHVGCVTRF